MTEPLPSTTDWIAQLRAAVWPNPNYAAFVERWIQEIVMKCPPEREQGAEKQGVLFR